MSRPHLNQRKFFDSHPESPGSPVALVLREEGLKDWACPHETTGKPCGAKPVGGRWVCSATWVSPEAEVEALGTGRKPEETPVAFDLFLACAEGHETYVRTKDVRG